MTNTADYQSANNSSSSGQDENNYYDNLDASASSIVSAPFGASEQGSTHIFTSLFETLIGTENDDTLQGTDLHSIILGRDGNDRLLGGGGNDVLSGGNGNDYLRGNDGSDWLIGGDGYDTLRGDAGNDYLYSGPGRGALMGGTGSDILDASGSSELVVASFFDLEEGISIDLNRGTAITATGDLDILINITGINSTNYNDTILGSDSADTILFANYHEGLAGYAGDDFIDGRAGNDVILGAEGNDVLIGGDGMDLIFAEYGNDTINGGTNDGADDVLWGEANYVSGGPTIEDSADVFVFAENFGHDEVADFESGIDLIDLRSFETNFEQLNWSSNGSSVTITIGDSSILLSNITTITEDDFIF